MEAKRKELRTLANEGYVNIDPKLVDELVYEAVQKLLDEYAKKVAQQQQSAVVLTTVGTIAETFGVRGAKQRTTDIANVNPPILENITSGKNTVSSVINLLKYKKELLLVTITGCSGLLAYDYFRGSNDEKEINNDGDVNESEKPKARRKTKRSKTSS